MTYKYYIIKNRLADNMESYTAYCNKYMTLLKGMNEKMKTQIIEANYRMRFVAQF